MRIREITEDAHGDMSVRSQISSVYRKLIKTVPSFNRTRSGTVVNGDFTFTIEYLTMKELGFAEYADLAIGVFRSDQKDVNCFGFYLNLCGAKHDLPVKFVICFPATGDSPMQDIVKSLREFGSTFVHEFVHYLDEKKHQGKARSVAPDQSRMEKYYNSPLEVNAYTHQGLDKFEKSKDFPALVQGSFRDFLIAALDHFPSYFVSHLTDKTEKSLTKRIYGLWKSHQPS